MHGERLEKPTKISFERFKQLLLLEKEWRDLFEEDVAFGKNADDSWNPLILNATLLVNVTTGWSAAGYLITQNQTFTPNKNTAAFCGLIGFSFGCGVIVPLFHIYRRVKSYDWPMQNIKDRTQDFGNKVNAFRDLIKQETPSRSQFQPQHAPPQPQDSQSQSQHLQPQHAPNLALDQGYNHDKDYSDRINRLATSLDSTNGNGMKLRMCAGFTTALLACAIGIIIPLSAFSLFQVGPA